MSRKTRNGFLISLRIVITIIFLNALFILGWFGKTGYTTNPVTTTLLLIQTSNDTNATQPNHTKIPQIIPPSIKTDSKPSKPTTIKLPKWWDNSCLTHKKHHKQTCILPLTDVDTKSIHVHINGPKHAGNDAVINTVTFNNNTNDVYIMKYKQNCSKNIFYTEYKVMRKLYAYNSTLNIAWLHTKLPFYHYQNECFFFMQQLPHTFAFKKMQRIARFEPISTVQKLVTELTEIDGGILEFIIKCFNEILPILKALMALNVYNDDINSRNILIDKYSHKCYLIDYGLTRNVTDLQWYNQNITIDTDIFTCLHYSCLPQLWEYKTKFNSYSVNERMDKLRGIGFSALQYQLWSMFFHTFIGIYVRTVDSHRVSETLEGMNYRFNLADNNNIHRTDFHFQQSFCKRAQIISLLQDINDSTYANDEFWKLMRLFDNDLLQIPSDKRHKCVSKFVVNESGEFNPYYLPFSINYEVQRLRFKNEKYGLPQKHQRCVRNVLTHNGSDTCMLPNNVSFRTKDIIGIGNHGTIYSVDIDGSNKYVLKVEKKWCVQLLNEYHWTFEFQTYLSHKYENLHRFQMAYMHPNIPFYSFDLKWGIEDFGCFVFVKKVRNAMHLHQLLYQKNDTNEMERVHDIIGGDIMGFLVRCYNDIITVFEKMYEFDRTFHNSLHIGNILVNAKTHKCYLTDFGSLWSVRKTNEMSCFLYSCAPTTFYYLQTLEKREIFKENYDGLNESVADMTKEEMNAEMDKELDRYAMYGKRYEMVSIIFHIFVEYYCVRNPHKMCDKLMGINHKIPLIYSKKTNTNESAFKERWSDRNKMVQILRKKQHKYRVYMTAEFWDLLSVFKNDV